MKIKESAFYHVKIKDWPEADRPREKLLQLGPERLSETELIAILLRTGTQTLSAVDLAKTITARYGNLYELSSIDPQELRRLNGVGEVKAVTLAAAFEISRRLASMPPKKKFKVNGPEVVFQRYGPRMRHLKKEIFHVLALSTANYLIRDIIISEGTLNASVVHPREIFKPAILESAASIVLVHNHPSGVAEPSMADQRITHKLVEAGKLLDIPVLDHIIIGEGSFFSFREEGMIDD